VLRRLESDLACAIQAATNAKRVPAKKPYNRARTGFIQELGRVYRDRTGDAPRGAAFAAFFDFVYACLCPIDRPHSEGALRKAIRRALQESS
jgi:hypothetical protein